MAQRGTEEVTIGNQIYITPNTLYIISHYGLKDEAWPLLQLSSMEQDCKAVGLR